MIKANHIKALCIGILFFPIRRFVKPQKKLWLFGSDKGMKYAQNSRYLFEYVRKKHPEIDAYWMTQSQELYNSLKERGVPVINNISIKGAYYSSKAQLKVVSTWLNDILYTFEGQNVANVLHGVPIKKIFYDHNVHTNSNSIIKSVINKLSDWFLLDYKLENTCFTPVPSQFFKEIESKAMRNENVYVVGQPRTDAFLHFDSGTIREKFGIDNNAFVVTYMPTHRAYGKGEPSPHIFIDNEEAINFFSNNNIVIIWKQHVNMLEKYQKREADKCFKEFSFDYSIDSQELLFISDVLITDFSSCFVDFMLLKRPILFYHYDDYEKNDNELYYGSELLEKIGSISDNEKKLFSDIKHAYLNKGNVTINQEWKLFNEFYDDKSCERSFNVLQEILNK